MKFKLRYYESINKLTVNCLRSYSTDCIFPDDVSEHILYDIPNDLAPVVQKKLNDLISQDQQAIWDDFNERQKQLVQERQEEMIKLKKELNPKIYKELENFKFENPELFI